MYIHIYAYIYTHNYIFPFIYVYICAYLYMESSFPKHDKRQSNNRGCYANAKFRDHVLEKSSFINIHIYTHIYICEKLYSKTQTMNLALTLQPHLFGMVLVLEKNSSYAYIRLYYMNLYI